MDSLQEPKVTNLFSFKFQVSNALKMWWHELFLVIFYYWRFSSAFEFKNYTRKLVTMPHIKSKEKCLFDSLGCTHESISTSSSNLEVTVATCNHHDIYIHTHPHTLIFELSMMVLVILFPVLISSWATLTTNLSSMSIHQHSIRIISHNYKNLSIRTKWCMLQKQ